MVSIFQKISAPQNSDSRNLKEISAPLSMVSIVLISRDSQNFACGASETSIFALCCTRYSIFSPAALLRQAFPYGIAFNIIAMFSLVAL